MDLYIQSPIRLHGAVLNSLSTGTILPYFHSFLISPLALPARLFSPPRSNYSPELPLLEHPVCWIRRSQRNISLPSSGLKQSSACGMLFEDVLFVILFGIENERELPPKRRAFYQLNNGINHKTVFFILICIFPTG
jgi:hypothetical protein